jgi:hypothetical protein
MPGEAKTYGVWIDGDEGWIHPHWLPSEDGTSEWTGNEAEATARARRVGGVIVEKPAPIVDPEVRSKNRIAQLEASLSALLSASEAFDSMVKEPMLAYTAEAREARASFNAACASAHDVLQTQST